MIRWIFAALLAGSLVAASAADFRTGPEGASVTVNGHQLWYWTEGTGEPLLLVEGGPGAAGYLDPFFHELTDRFTVIHFRGFGRGKSERASSPAGYSFEGDVADIEGFRRAVGLESLNLLGHSYAGLVVTSYALQHPKAVKRLIVCNGLLSGAAWQAESKWSGCPFPPELLQQRSHSLVPRLRRHQTAHILSPAKPQAPRPSQGVRLPISQSLSVKSGEP